MKKGIFNKSLMAGMLMLPLPLFAAIDVTGSSDNWSIIMEGSQFDPAGDDQAQANDSIDLVGNDGHGTLYVDYDDIGNGIGDDDEIGFRIRVAGTKNGATVSNGVMWIGMDLDLDNDIDVYLALDANGKTGNQYDVSVKVFETGATTNTSPSTASEGSAQDVNTELLDGTEYAYRPVDVTTDPSHTDADLNNDPDSTGDAIDHFISFKVTWAALKAAIDAAHMNDGAGAGATTVLSALNNGTGISQTSEIQFILASSTQNNAINGDFGGYNGLIDDSNIPFVDQPAFSPVLSLSNIFPVLLVAEADVTVLSSTLDLAEALFEISASDADNDALTFSLTGVDASLFDIDTATGAITFKSAPDVDSPGDDGADNVYNLTVNVSDGKKTVTRDLSVTVTVDTDEDGIVDSDDNCPFVENPNQENVIGSNSALGDVCDDEDSDTVVDASDNCPVNANEDQANSIGSNSALGDVCDDEDSDNVVDASDNCPVNANEDQANSIGSNSALGDVCDDEDSDTIVDADDACPLDPLNICDQDDEPSPGTIITPTAGDADNDGYDDLIEGGKDYNNNGVDDATEKPAKVETARKGLGSTNGVFLALLFLGLMARRRNV